MTVEPDGTAHFRDKPDFTIHLPLPSLDTLRHLPSAMKALPGGIRDATRAWYQSVQAQNAYDAHYDRRQHLAEIPQGCDDYAELDCIDPDSPAPPPNDGAQGLIGGQADVSSWLERKLVGDPYASRKKRLLEDSFRARAEHGQAYRADQALHAAERMRANVERMWASTPDPAARRAALYELWAECSLDDAGLRAREIVMLWIAEHPPAGSANAYTPDELARDAGFHPYQ